jgi:hypothetical protein
LKRHDPFKQWQFLKYIFLSGSEGAHTACRFIVQLDATAKGVQAVCLPTLASVPTPHFEGAGAPSGCQEYSAIDIAFKRSLPIKRACIAPAAFDKAFKFIVASHYSKTFIHFSKGFTIFCEGDQESANNGKDDEVIVWQKSNLPSLLSLALAISTQAALDASAPYNTLAATGHNIAFGPAFNHNMAFSPAFGHSKLIKLIGCIGLGVSFIGLGVSFIGLGVSFIDGFVCCVDLSYIGLGGHNGNISLIGFGFVLPACRLINFIGLGIEGLISKNGFIGLGLIGFIGLGLGSLVNGISLIGLVGLIGFIGLVGLVSFGLNG